MTALAEPGRTDPIAGLIEFFAEFGNGLRFLSRPRICACRYESEPCPVCAGLARLAHAAVDSAWVVLPTSRRAHLVRGNGAAVCGTRHADRLMWAPAPDEIPRCRNCSEPEELTC